MSRRNGKYIHNNQLRPSSPDHVALGIAVDDRFVTVCERYQRTTGDQLFIPESLSKDMMRWRQMRVRHKKGDYRHTDAELESLHGIAQWTVTENEKICGQAISKPIDWGRKNG